MGRAKIAMEFISKEKTRNSTYVKRKKGLLKKGHELAILCDVPICIIIYPYNDGSKPLEGEVYAYNGGDTATSSNMVASDIIERYKKVSKDERSKRALNLHDMFGEWTRKADQELCKLRNKNASANNYPSLGCDIDVFSIDQLMELLVHLDLKIEYVKQRIGMVKTSLVPYVEPPPVSSHMGPAENGPHHHYQFHQIGCYPEFERFNSNNNNNQIPIFNFPINNQHQEYCNQLVVPNFMNQPQLAFPDQVIGPTRMDGQYDGCGNNNLVTYHMNMVGGVGPMYYDQRSVIGDDVEASYRGGAPMPMPLQFPMLQPDQHRGTLTKQMQFHQMFYN